jgi:DNA polymerase III epsilon subunit-like protein
MQETDNAPISSKKLKKALKRAAKGSCNSLAIYVDNFKAGVKGVPEVVPVDDVLKSRHEAKFSYDSSEIRGLLSSLLLNKEALPRPFRLKNRYCARNVALLHISDWVEETENSNSNVSKNAYTKLQELLNEVNTERDAAKAVAKTKTKDSGNIIPFQPLKGVRVSKHPERELVPIQNCLLTVPISDVRAEMGSNFISTEVKKTHNMPLDLARPEFVPESDQYEAILLPIGAQQMWGYAVPVNDVRTDLQALCKTSLQVNEDEDEDEDRKVNVDDSNDENPLKRQRLADYQKQNEGINSVSVISAPPVSTKVCLDIDNGSMFNIAVPSVEDAQNLKSRLSHLRAIYNNTTYGDYTCTLQPSSADYAALFTGKDKCDGVVERSPSLQQLVSIDCEMCLTKAGKELARLSIIGSDAIVLLDVFVQPELPIENYLTQYSGITEEILATSNTLTFAQAQIAFLRIVSANTVVVGHSVDSDMKALKLFHGRFIDTAIIYPHPKGFPMRLKLSQLAFDHLKINIQDHMATQQKWRNNNGCGMQSFLRAKKRDSSFISQVNSKPSSLGHDSVEDARVALALVYLKAKRGLAYALNGKGSSNMNGAPLLALGDLFGSDPTRVALQRVGLFWESGEQAKAMTGCLAGQMEFRISDTTTATVEAASAFLDSLPLTNDLPQYQEQLSGSEVDFPHLSMTMAVVRHFPSPPMPKIDSPPFLSTSVDSAALATRTEVVKKAIHSLLHALDRRAENGKGGGILIFTAQPPLDEALALRHRQYLNSTGNTLSSWTADDQLKMKKSTAAANLGTITFAAVE